MIAAVLLSAVVAAPGADAGPAPLVPAAVQARIAQAAPRLAYVPTRIAIGFRYARWESLPGAVRIRFRNKAGWEITFVAMPLKGSCAAAREKTYQLDGNRVFWAHTETEQHAWRCVARPGGGLVRLLAATTRPADRFAAVGLGIVVASGKRIG